MPALPEYKTRQLLADKGVPMVKGVFVAAGSEPRDTLPKPPVYLKAQIPGATSRAAQGLVRRADSEQQIMTDLKQLMSPGPWGRAHGVLIAEAVSIRREYYAACMLDVGSRDRLPGGVLIFSARGGSGVEQRSDVLRKISFSVLDPPRFDALEELVGEVENPSAVARFLDNMIHAFLDYQLIVLEINPIGLLGDGSVLVIDCRAEFEKHAVLKKIKEHFEVALTQEEEPTPLERKVERINRDDPAGTGFFRQNREPEPVGAYRVATNLCGGGGKMLWEMAAGLHADIYSLNESDTSGGLSAFKSYRLLRVILEIEDAQVLLLTGSGMAFQNQYHLAAAVFKGLRESPTPLPALLRFGGTDEDKALELFHKVAAQLPVKVKTYLSYVFPNAMIDDIPRMAAQKRAEVEPESPPRGQPTFCVDVPPGEFFYYPDRWNRETAPPCVGVCPTGFLTWNPGTRTIDPAEGARCIGCLLCETTAWLEGSRELRIRLGLPEVAP